MELWLVGAVHAIQRIDAVFMNVQRARAKRVVETRLHAIAVLLKVRFAVDHRGWRRPGGPLALPGDAGPALPFKPGPANANPVADGPAAGQHQVEIMGGGIHHHRARRLTGGIIHLCPPELLCQHATSDGRNRELLSGQGAVDVRQPRSRWRGWSRCFPSARRRDARGRLLGRQVEVAVDGLGAGVCRPAGGRQGQQAGQIILRRSGRTVATASSRQWRGCHGRSLLMS